MKATEGWVRGAGLLVLALAGCSDATPTHEPEASPSPVATSLSPAMIGRWGQDGACKPALEIAADRIAGDRIDAITTSVDGAVDVDTVREVNGITTGRRYRLANARGERLAVTVDGRTTTRIRCP